MNIKSLKIKGLHGYFDKEIEFNNDLTLLVGINGSGKTTILNILNWILNLKIEELVLIQFEYIKVDLLYGNEEYRINCTFSSSFFLYQIENDSKTYTPLRYNAKYKQSEFLNDVHLKKTIKESIRAMGPDSEELETWNLIRSFPKPTIMGLDRSFYTEEDDGYYEDRESIARRSSKSLFSPLDRINQILTREYTSIKNEVSKLTEQLKNFLMLSTFEGNIITLDSIVTESEGLSIKQIEDVEDRLRLFFRENEQDAFSEKDMEVIADYFNKLKEIVNRYEEKPKDTTLKLIFNLNSSQFVKVNKLLERFERYEKISFSKRSRITLFLSTINSFFKDSSKEILFDETHNVLKFNNLNKNGEPITRYRDIDLLSSGEQQILILFTYIAFNSQDGKIFLMDEPELSLHIKWQDEFLEHLEKITPKSTQIIIATHSPIIANQKKNKAEVLFPYNL